MFVFYSLAFFLSFIIIFFSFSSNITKLKKPSVNFQHPPSPQALPIIGHLHLLGPSIAKFFQALAAQYGPLMRLQIVSASTIVVSNAAIAREILKDQEMSFVGRPEFGCSGYNVYEGYSFMFAKYGKYWRFMRKLCVTQLLSTAQVKGFVDIRKEEMMKLLETMAKCSEEKKACNIGSELSRMINTITCRVLMSTTEDESRTISNLVKEILETLPKYNLGELFGPLGKLGFSHHGRKIKALLLELDEILEKKMAERDQKKERKDIMDLLLEVYRDENGEMKLSKNHIKNFLWEMLMAGTDTTSDALLWTMAELINHTRVFHKLREEINSVVGSERLVEDSDIPNLHYMQAVVKETLRFHPPASLVLRRCVKDCKIDGYDIVAGENVYLNLIPIMRDPSVWENPLDFVPERFVGKSSQGDGMSFKWMAFGGGRRGCPGAALALAVSHSVIAALVQCFDFGLGEGRRELNMEGTGAVSNGVVHPVLCFPNRHLNPFVVGS